MDSAKRSFASSEGFSFGDIEWTLIPSRRNFLHGDMFCHRQAIIRTVTNHRRQINQYNDERTSRQLKRKCCQNGAFCRTKTLFHVHAVSVYVCVGVGGVERWKCVRVHVSARSSMRCVKARGGCHLTGGIEREAKIQSAPQHPQ